MACLEDIGPAHGRRRDASVQGHAGEGAKRFCRAGLRRCMAAAAQEPGKAAETPQEQRGRLVRGPHDRGGLGVP